MTKSPKHQKDPQVSGIFRAFLDNETAIKGFLRRFLYKRKEGKRREKEGKTVYISGEESEVLVYSNVNRTRKSRA